MGLEWLGEPLAFLGLVIATALYYLFIRRRRRAAEDYLRELEGSRHRAAMRFRHMRRRDDR